MCEAVREYRRRARIALAEARYWRRRERSPESFARSLGIHVDTHPFHRGIQGLYLSLRDGGEVIAINDKLTCAHRHFVLAHELGHAMLDPDLYPAQRTFLRDRDEDSRAVQEQEQVIDLFASRLSGVKLSRAPWRYRQRRKRIDRTLNPFAGVQEGS